MPSPRRARASSVLGSRAKLPDPPRFENGEAVKPCPLCRKNFSEAEFNDSTWWNQEVTDAGSLVDACLLCCLPLVEPKESIIEKPSEERKAPDEAGSDEETATHLEEPAVDQMMSLVMNHIADHLQFLALLTVRLSARRITDGDKHSFSSSPALSSDQFSEKKALGITDLNT
ncbi:hypothetical protein MKX08_006198 [Trichoderma sp. CBMAI-0020]|nr:hypothetical protein MKX08_006198 [Trichoderma sp. CBMAI-0020]